MTKDDTSRLYQNAILLRIYDEVRDIRSPHRPLTGLPQPGEDPALPTESSSISGRITPHLGPSDIQGMPTEELCDMIRRLEDEQKRRDRKRDIQALKAQARKATRHKTWPLIKTESPHRSRAFAGPGSENEVPL